MADVQTLAMILYILLKADDFHSSAAQDNHKHLQHSNNGANGSAVIFGFSTKSSPSRPSDAAMQRDNGRISRTEVESLEERNVHYFSAASSWGKKTQRLFTPQRMNATSSTSYLGHLQPLANITSRAARNRLLEVLSSPLSPTLLAPTPTSLLHLQEITPRENSAHPVVSLKHTHH